MNSDYSQVRRVLLRSQSINNGRSVTACHALGNVDHLEGVVGVEGLQSGRWSWLTDTGGSPRCGNQFVTKVQTPMISGCER